jgi:hypothetical protein
MSKRHNTFRLVIFPFKKMNQMHLAWARLALMAITLEPPFPPIWTWDNIWNKPHFVVVEASSFRLPTNISLGLARFKRNPFLHKISFGLKPRALELFGLLPS